MRHTNIVATIGPATSGEAAINDLIAAGVDIFRLNFSHGTHAGHAAVIARIREAAVRQGHSVALLQDLSGPKIRTGLLRDGQPIRLNIGDDLRIVVGDMPGEPGMVTTTYAPLPDALKPGDLLLLDDGRIQLQVEAAGGGDVRTRVVDGGLLGEHKGITAPGVPLPSGALTAKDREDLLFGVSAGVDLVALSFVQRPEDLIEARNALVQAGAPGVPLIAKLERPEAIAHLEGILLQADAVMVARGDLGLELPLEQVPRVQK
jgi:pyruvate kinase